MVRGGTRIGNAMIRFLAMSESFCREKTGGVMRLISERRISEILPKVCFKKLAQHRLRSGCRI